MLLGSAVIQVGTRSPVMIAQTAMTLAHLSGGRFLLGLGVSGPQVIEGLHGVPFAHPLARMRETVQIARSVFAGDKVSFQGTQYRIPLPGSEGRPMRVSVPPVSVPVYLAALSPKMLELTGELADGWLGTSFVPEGAAAYFVDPAGLAQAVASRKKQLAFSLGGMGSASTNFYNDAYSRQGWGQTAAEVRERWQAGDRDGAAGLITDEMVLATTLIGTEGMVRDRLKTWRDTGVDTVRLYPAGETLAGRLDNLARAIDLVHSLG
jgi:alkanesulfonate monooxygenase SsuD/methylene tetrahydromethanopterin reductase-like flavin-dependent oxidoreductase (luciferase family)